MKWKKLGEGSFNVAYRSDNGNGHLIFKVCLDKNMPTDLPERSVRLWNMINAHIRPLAEVARQKINGKWVTGWICPYIEGRQANDLEMRDELLAIFNRTGRVITDVSASRNFLRTRDGHTVCIDIGLALEGEAREMAGLVGLSRKPSLTSLEVWDDLASQSGRGPWLDAQQTTFPKAIRTTKALLFIKEQRPDITNVDFLKKSPKTTKLLANAYDKGQGPVFDQALASLSKKRSPDLELSKQRCRDIFLEYIHKKGTINQYDQFVPKSSEHLRDMPYINRVMTLMREVNTATSCEACHAIIGKYVAECVEQGEEEITDMSFYRADSPRVSKAGSSYDELENVLRDLAAETKDMTVLDDIKKQCRDILGAYILSFGQQDRMYASSNTAQYKLQLFVQRVNEKVTMLIEELEDADSFEDMSICLDTFSQQLPPSPKRDAAVVNELLESIDGLLVSLGLCRRIVASAQRAEQNTPSAETGAGLEI